MIVINSQEQRLNKKIWRKQNNQGKWSEKLKEKEK